MAYIPTKKRIKSSEMRPKTEANERKDYELEGLKAVERDEGIDYSDSLEEEAAEINDKPRKGVGNNLRN